MQYTITNKGGFLAARNVRIACYVRSLDMEGGGGITNIGVDNVGWRGGTIEPGDSQTIDCHVFNFTGTPRHANVLLLSTYEIAGIPWTLRRTFRFEGVRGDEWVWRQEPVPSDIDQIMDDFEHGHLTFMLQSARFSH